MDGRQTVNLFPNGRLGSIPRCGTKKNMKTYVIRKYVKAKSALDAIKKEKKKEVDDVYVYEHNDNEIGFRSTSVVGVEVNTESSEYELEEKNTL